MIQPILNDSGRRQDRRFLKNLVVIRAQNRRIQVDLVLLDVLDYLVGHALGGHLIRHRPLATAVLLLLLLRLPINET